MSPAVVSFFDGLAANYDQAWTNSPAGRMQRDAVWREVDRFVSPGTRVLDLGCGTGEDAAHFLQRGAIVEAIDGSPNMVDAARRKGVNAGLLRIEDLGQFRGEYDLVFSNFGALNCVADLAVLREPLAALTRPGGTLAICVMNRFCLWETLHYAVRARFKKAARRWSGSAQASGGLRVFYPLVGAIRRAFVPDFQLIRDIGIGIAVPPSYVDGFTHEEIARRARIDSRIAASWPGRALADHRLLMFSRTQ